MAEIQLGLLTDLSLGYAGVHRTLFEALRFLVHLQPGDLSQVAEEDRVCVICGDPPSDNFEHELVQLDCGHFFGRSCLLSWLTPLDKEGDGVTVDFNDDGEDEEEEEEEEDEGPEDSSSRARQSTAELPEVGSQSTSPWTPMNGNPNYVGPSSLTEGQEVDNQQMAFLQTFQAPIETFPRRRGIRDPIYTYGRHSEGNSQAVERGEQLRAAPLATLEFDDPMARSTGWVPLTGGTPSQEPPQAEDIQGVVVYPLSPGNNTCPLCRAAVFPKPVHGDSLQCIRVRIRAWDLAYKYTCIERNALEDDFRFTCIAFGHMWDSARATTGEVDEVTPGYELRRIFHDAASTLVALEQQPQHYFGRQWTDEQRQALEHFGRYMKFREDDVPVWFGTDLNVSMIHVWTGPDWSSRVTRRSRSNWVQVRIKDHPYDFRLGSEDEEEEPEEEEEGEEADEDEEGTGREHGENEGKIWKADGDVMTEDSPNDRFAIESLEYGEGGDDEVTVDDAVGGISPIVSDGFRQLEQSERGSSDDLSSIASGELEELEQMVGGPPDDFLSLALEELEQLERRSSDDDDEAMSDWAETESPDEVDDAMDLDYDPAVEL
ncbi:MAG: hypothetical protein Q9196_002813 [Gyalolechia fulgens]